MMVIPTRTCSEQIKLVVHLLAIQNCLLEGLYQNFVTNKTNLLAYPNFHNNAYFFRKRLKTSGLKIYEGREN